MVSSVNTFDELIMRAKMKNRQVRRVDELVSQGYISKRLGSYAQHLLVLDHLSDEARTYSSLGRVNKTIESLTEMKIKLHSVGALLLADGEIKSEEVDGIKYLANPNFDNIEKYRELYDIAQKKYDDSLSECEIILEGAA